MESVSENWGWHRRSPHGATPGALVELWTSSFFTVAVSQCGTNCGMACLDLPSYRDIPRRGGSHGMRLTLSYIYFFFFYLKYIVQKACSMSPAKATHLGRASIIHHNWHFDPALRLRLEMAELPPYVKSAFALFTVCLLYTSPSPRDL